ncbi:MAG: hypothetical protein NTZ80_03795 [Patescibacteria group bacterium]|nr:hypothetical protein [Patescibacteria group bacterium]
MSTTPESTMAALETFKKEKISALLLGGTDRKLNFSALAKEIIKRRIKYIVLFPDSGERIWKTILKYKADFVPEKLITNSMNEAIKWIYKNVKSSSFVLLSCASPSYTLWKDFNEKGNEFQKTVKKLGKQKPS